MMRGWPSMASTYSGKVSQLQVMPADMAMAGMSSTASIRSINQSRSWGRTGAKPIPQPITTVVTPFQQEGVKVGIPRHLGVEVGVDVDPAGDHQLAGGIDVAPCRAHVAAERGDGVAVDADVARELRAAAAVDDAAIANCDVVHWRARIVSTRHSSLLTALGPSSI